MTLARYMAMADMEVLPAPERVTMGLFDTRVASLRAYQRYSSNATVDVYDLAGRLRWLGQKQARVHAIVHRLAGNRERMTMTAIAEEAGCCTSTVSRAILKFQSWGMFAIDVTRGRNGGISVRLRHWGDQLHEYAERAWDRLRHAARNVASTLTKKEKELVPSTSEYPTGKDATFIDPIDWEGLLEDARRRWLR
jgi:hypothetical protein